MMGGTFRFVDEQGLPLDLLVDWLKDRGMMMDWLDFYRSSVEQGWPRKRTTTRLRMVVGDVYGPEWAEEWFKRFVHHVDALEAGTVE
jgi:hypothetical protein